MASRWRSSTGTPSIVMHMANSSFSSAPLLSLSMRLNRSASLSLSELTQWKSASTASPASTSASDSDGPSMRLVELSVSSMAGPLAS